MRARTAWLAGAAGAGMALYRKLRRAPAPPSEADPRAEELRRKLDESRTVVEEQHEQAASPETPVDEVNVPAEEAAAEAGVEDRRQAVHDRARAAAEEMRGGGSGSAE